MQDSYNAVSNKNNSSSLSSSFVMTDEEIIEYIKEEQKKGTDNKVIVTNLMRRGVTTEQLNNIRKNYIKDSKKRLITKDENDEFVRIREKNTVTGDLGIVRDSLDVLLPDSIGLLKLKEELEDNKIKIFGHNIFKDKELNFEPNLNISTPVNYKLGPGDEVIVDIWGSVQSTATDIISPDGYINIENIGLVYLNGMTVKEADAYIKEQFSQIHAGISGDSPNANIKLTLGQIRTIQVRVMGEVENPGTYSLSAFASVFHALYQAGGVNDIGTLRAIKVFRGNNKVVTLDVYDYLLNGKTGDDVRLEDGDVITVDTYNCLVNVEGKVKRPMYYEMKPTETVADLLRYSGGFTRDAYRGDVRIERMGERERQIFTLNDNEQKNFPVRDGDIMSVDSIRDTYENMVEAKGAFFRPGKFQCGSEISTVKQLVEKAGGLRPDAFTNRALLNRRLPDMTMENRAIDIKGIMDGKVTDVELRPNDVLYVQSISEVEETKVLMIYGEVAFPGKYRYAENTSIEDLILLAGGLKDKASTVKVEVARRTRDSEATVSGDTLAEIFTFSIDKGLVVAGNPEFVLKPYDAVYVRRSPKYYEEQNVMVSGEVEFAGTYVLDRKGLRLSDVVKNAGGLTNKAYAKGARLERKMTAEQRAKMLDAMKTMQKQMDSLEVSEIEIKPIMQVGIELDKALASPGSDADIVLEDGDRLIIPQITNTVKVDGNVMFPNAVAYKEGAKLKHYIRQAGGYGMNAKKSKAIVVYMNGTVAEASNSKDLIQPGCQIIVPTKIARKGLSTSEIFSLASSSASLATVVLALINLLK
ncbi:MAG: SLBB domain-containing protein [Bacteroidaceae bacterium]|nr:SLBB domain-containing protein [Bacteroidaceae bacterium]